MPEASCRSPLPIRPGASRKGPGYAREKGPTPCPARRMSRRPPRSLGLTSDAPCLASCTPASRSLALGLLRARLPQGNSAAGAPRGACPRQPSCGRANPVKRSRLLGMGTAGVQPGGWGPCRHGRLGGVAPPSRLLHPPRLGEGCPRPLAPHRGRRLRPARPPPQPPRRGLPGDPRHRTPRQRSSSASSRPPRSSSPRSPSSIPGIGLLTATALVAFLGDIRRFPSGRHLATYLGLTPREFSSGLERRLGTHLQARRRLPAHPPHPRCPLPPPPRPQGPADPLRHWAHKIEKTHPHNKAAVAVANKLARILWAVSTHGSPYGQPRRRAA